ncbi:MAG TPA: T9SS type A sorting domain-containing protein [Bacteroidia bacterium]|nr:T9SS type A sorting domain-containing protein [Bacteroidia bacterium]
MKKRIAVILFFILPATLPAQPLVPDWLTPGYCTYSNDSRVLDVVTDSQGNIYAAGTCYDTLTFGSLVTVYPPNSSRNAFVAKFDAAGNPLWVTPIYGPGNEEFLYLALSNNDHLYVTGTFDDSIVVLDTITLVHQSARDNYIAYFDTSGHALWALSGTGNGSEITHGVATDSQGNAIIIGYLVVGTVPATLQFGNVVLQDANLHTDMLYLFKFSNTGNVLWGQQLYTDQGLGNLCGVNDIGVDSLDNIYLCGAFWAPTLYFSGSPLMLQSSNNQGPYLGDIFVCKYSPSGTLLYAHKTGTTAGETAQVIAVNPGGDFFLSGTFTNSIQLGNSLTNADATGQTDDAFVAHYSNAGFPQWGRRISSGDNDLPVSLARDGQGGVYLLDISDLGTILVDTVLYTGYKKFIAQFSGAGVVQGITPVLTSGTMYPNTITRDANNNVIQGGSFINTIVFNGVSYVDPPGTGGTAYVARFTPPALSVQSTLSDDPGLKVFPNPSSGEITLLLNGDYLYVSIFDMDGRLVFEEPVQQLQQLLVQINHPGMYLVKAIGEKRVQYKTIAITE